jgi:hypothetical protein
MATWGSISVVYSSSDVTLNDIQEINIEQGRQWTTDPYDAARMIIRCRNIAGWGSPNPKIGQRIRCNITPTGGAALNYFVGRITDVAIEYGNKTSMDTATITCEGALGYLARRQLTAQALTQKNTTEQAYDAVVASGVNVTTYYDSGLSIASAQTYTGNLLDLVNKLIPGTEYGRIKQWGGTSSTSPNVEFYRRNQTSTFVYVTDDPSAISSYVRYDKVFFTSGQDNHYTQVTVQPQGLATQVATNGSTYWGLTVSSLDYTTSQALSHAQYLVNNFSNTDSEIAGFSFSLMSQTQMSSVVKRDTLEQFQSQRQVAASCSLEFRGTSYLGIVEGVSITIAPDDIYFMVYLSPRDLNAYLILDDANYGQLDENKLGF